MPVGKSSLFRANGGINVNKTIDKKVVLDNAICEIAINDLEYNAKKAEKGIITSLSTYGLISPVIAVKKGDKLLVIDGVKRVNALKELGLETVKVVVVSGDAEELKKELSSFKIKEIKQVEEKKEENLHEQKFKVISNLISEIPVWLL